MAGRPAELYFHLPRARRIGQPGTLYSYTIVGVPPVGCHAGVPHSLGQVELPEFSYLVSATLACLSEGHFDDATLFRAAHAFEQHPGLGKVGFPTLELEYKEETPMPIRRPTSEDLRRSAAANYFELSEQELADFQILISDRFAAYQELEQMPSPREPLKYPDRDPGIQAHPGGGPV